VEAEKIATNQQLWELDKNLKTAKTRIATMQHTNYYKRLRRKENNLKKNFIMISHILAVH
jgi:hypothetical protein